MLQFIDEKTGVPFNTNSFVRRFIGWVVVNKIIHPITTKK